MDFPNLGTDAIATLITAAVMAAGLAFGLLLVWMTLRQTRAWIRRLGEGVDARLTATHGRGMLDRHAFEFVVRSRRQGPSVLHVTLAAPCPENLLIRREQPRHRLFKDAGLTGEIETGIPDFDARYLLAATHAAFVRDYLAPASRREAVDALFALGYDEIEIGPDGIDARQDPWQGIDAMPDRLVADTLPRLAALAGNLPLIAPLPVEKRAPAIRDYRIVWLALALSLLGSMLAFWGGIVFTPVDTWQVIGAGVSFALAALIGFGRWAWLRTRGAADSHERWLGAMVIGALGFPILGWGLVSTLNGALDPAAPTVHTVAVLAKSKKSLTDQPAYRVRLAPWGQRTEAVWLSVSPATYGNTRSRSVYRVEIGKGALGFEWVAGIELLGER